MVQSLFHNCIQHFSLLVDHAQQFCSFLHSDSSSCACSGKHQSWSVPFRMFLSKLPVPEAFFCSPETSNYILLYFFPKVNKYRKISSTFLDILMIFFLLCNLISHYLQQKSAHSVSLHWQAWLPPPIPMLSAQHLHPQLCTQLVASQSISTVLLACPVELHTLPFLSRKLSQQVSLVRFALEPPTVISSLEQ